MTKVIFIAKKRTGLTDDEFIAYWQQVHAPLVAKIPGVLRYLIQPVTRAVAGAEIEPVCDGIAEIWFDTLARVQDAQQSREGRAAAADIAKFCAAGTGAVIVDEAPLPDSSG